LTALHSRLTNEQKDEVRYWINKVHCDIVACYSQQKSKYKENWSDILKVDNIDFESRLENGFINQWNKEVNYDDGVAIICGQLRRGPNKGDWITCFDFDKKEAVDSFCEILGISLEDLAKWTLVEWHGSPERIHVFVISKTPFHNLPAGEGLEVKAGNPGPLLAFVSPSLHKGDNEPYRAYDSNRSIAIIDNVDKQRWESVIEIFVKKRTNDQKSYFVGTDAKSQYIDYLNAEGTILRAGERHPGTVINGTSMFFKYLNGWQDLSDDERFTKLVEWHNKHCKPTLFEEHGRAGEIEKIWEDIKKKFTGQCQEERDGREVDKKVFGDTIAAFPEHIREKLGNNTVKIIGYNPLTLIVNDEYGKELVKSIVAPPKSKFDISGGNDDSESTTTTTTVSGTTKKTEVKTKSKLKYMPKNVIIDAAITNLVINENPLDKGSKTYKITFAHKSIKKPFTIGPGNVSQIIQELQNRGRYVRTKDAVEGLSAILAELEDRADQEGGTIKTTINRKIPQPGYYYIPEISNDIICNETTQQDIDPSTEEGRKKILDCIEVLEGLYTRNKHKEAFATVIRFSTIAPFGYAKKCMDTTGSNWLPNIDLWGFTRVGKNTLGRVSLAIWRKNGHKDELVHSIGFTKADTEARLGIAVSKTSYHINIHEIGNLSEKKMQNISEMIKHVTESTNARGKYEQDGRYTDIPALSGIIFTSNDPPPQDPAFQVRVLPIHFTKNYATTAAQKKAFEIWFYTEKRIDMLGVLGDFITKYIILPNPEILKKDWLELSKYILTEFYKSVGKKPSKWFDIISKEDVVEQSIEDAYFQLRGFFVNTIMDHYRKDFKIDPTETPKEIEDKLLNCLLFHTMPFMSLHDNQKGIAEIIITHNIIPELLKHNIESVTSMDALATELPGFKRGPKKVNGKTMKVVFGPYDDFKKFLNIDITETVRQTKLPGKGLDPILG
jgi:hypothetical protein